MPDNTMSLAELRSRVSALPVTLHDGEQTAAVRLDQAFSLGSVVIALGEDDCTFDEEAFPGVVYQPSSPPATVIVSGDGTVVAIDAVEEADAREAVSNVIETLDDLGLIVDEQTPDIITDTQTVSFAPNPPEVETLSYDDNS